MTEFTGDFRAKVDGDAIVRAGQHTMYGMITGDLLVDQDARIAVKGTVGGNLLVSDGAYAQVSGIVIGAIRVSIGASVQISGMVGSVSGPGSADILPGAIVGGLRH